MLENAERKNKKDAGNLKDTSIKSDKQKHGKDYWDRVADDVASGYRSDEDKNNILNIDQEPDDHESGDNSSLTSS